MTRESHARARAWRSARARLRLVVVVGVSGIVVVFGAGMLEGIWNVNVGNGALLGVRLAKSSGNARIDKLALAAVKQAGRFPAAPKSLGIARHSFRLPIKSK